MTLSQQVQIISHALAVCLAEQFQALCPEHQLKSVKSDYPGLMEYHIDFNIPSAVLAFELDEEARVIDRYIRPVANEFASLVFPKLTQFAVGDSALLCGDLQSKIRDGAALMKYKDPATKLEIILRTGGYNVTTDQFLYRMYLLAC